MTVKGNRKTRLLRTDDVIIFFIGLLALFYIDIVGQLYLSEIILILLAPLLWVRKSRALLGNPDARKILLLGLVWFLGQVLTDLIRQTPLPDLARGWAGIVVLLISFSSLYLLLGNNTRRIKIFIFGYVLSGLISPFIQPLPYFADYPWKFGFGHPVVLLAFLFVIGISQGYLKQMGKWLWLIIAVGVLSFFLNARALGGAVLFSAVILWLRTSPMTRRILSRLNVKNLLITSLLIVVIGWGLLAGYAYSAERGWLGQNSKAKFEMQYNNSLISLIVGGRYSILASSRAILDSPIIGHGSWAKDMKYRLYLFELADLGYQLSAAQLENVVYESDLIPAHSHLMQAWVWAGLLGALFWGWVLVFVGRTFIRASVLPNELYPLLLFFCIIAVWHILFSPFGSLARVQWALRFVVFLSVNIWNEK